VSDLITLRWDNIIEGRIEFVQLKTKKRHSVILSDVLNNTQTFEKIQKLERKDLTTYIYIGAPKSAELGTEPRIQLADQLASVGDVQQWVILQRESINEAERTKFTVSIKADVDAKMGLISDIKQELRKAQSLKLSYSANPAASAEELYKAY
jgi:hypothetical protein